MEPELLFALTLWVTDESGNQSNYKTLAGGLTEHACVAQQASIQEAALPGHYIICKPEAAQ